MINVKTFAFFETFFQRSLASLSFTTNFSSLACIVCEIFGLKKSAKKNLQQKRQSESF